MESKNCIFCNSAFLKKDTCSKTKWETIKYCSISCSKKQMWKDWKWVTQFVKWMTAPNKWKVYTEEQKLRMKLFQKWHKLVWTENLRKWRENGGTPWNKWTYWYEIHGGSKSPLKKVIRSSQKYLNWRKQIRERDNYTCLECWRKRKPWDRVILEVDHIIPFAKILKDNKIESLESAYSNELLWDISNWRTLCKECHKKTESHWSNQWKS